MADELSEQIKVVEAKIAKVEGRIETVTEQLERIVARLEGPELRGDHPERAEVLEREKGVRAEVQRLGKELDRLRAEKEILLKAKYGAGCRSWPATTLCARTLAACLLSCYAP